MRIDKWFLDVVIWKLLVYVMIGVFWWSGGGESLIGVGLSDNGRIGNGDNEYEEVKFLKKFIVRGVEKWGYS